MTEKRRAVRSMAVRLEPYLWRRINGRVSRERKAQKNPELTKAEVIRIMIKESLANEQ